MATLAFSLLVLCAAFVTAAGVGLAAVLGAARFLEARESIAPADLLVVFAGDYPFRAAHAADLFHRAYAREIVTTGQWVADELCVVGMPLRGAELSALALRQRGVPAKRIHVLPYGRNTAEEAAAVRRFVAREAVRRVIAVTSPYHVRRARWLLRDALADTPAAVQGSAAPTPAGARWWRTKSGVLHLGNELLKIAYHLLPEAIRGRMLLAPSSYLASDWGCPAT
jgi:uncharacterized SAM-binding protein YcdF (DUF218 family)